MTYKWEAIAQDLTEERDRLLEKNKVLKDALIAYVKLTEEQGWTLTPAAGIVLGIARAALKSEKQ